MLIQLKSISKVYKGKSQPVAALKDIDLTITPGELTAIMGPSGSGKSTLMNILGCLDKPSSGEYILEGRDISSLDDYQLSLIRANQIGFVFQAYNLIQHLTVTENVALPFTYRNNIPANYKEFVLGALQRVGLGHRLTHLPRELSGGEMQRVAIARALSIAPSLILADEPTGNLDFETGQSILELLKNLNAQGTTVLIVTHDEDVGRSCRRMIKMRDGKLANIQE